RINYSDGHTGHRMADLSPFTAHLSKACGTEIVSVHRNSRRAFGATITFQGPDAELFLERKSQSLGKFLRAGHDNAQTAEVFSRAAAQIKLQESGCGQQECELILADQWANCSRIERIGIKHHAKSEHGRRAQRPGEAKRMEKWKHAQQTILARKTKN